MNIYSIYTVMNQVKLHQEVGVSVIKMAMDSMKVQGADLTQMLEASTEALEQSVNPHIGGNIDISI